MTHFRDLGITSCAKGRRTKSKEYTEGIILCCWYRYADKTVLSHEAVSNPVMFNDSYIRHRCWSYRFRRISSSLQTVCSIFFNHPSCLSVFLFSATYLCYFRLLFTLPRLGLSFAFALLLLTKRIFVLFP